MIAFTIEIYHDARLHELQITLYYFSLRFQFQFSSVNSLLLVKCCFCNGKPVFNFKCTFCV